MFERMQEIIDDGIREANDKYVKEVVRKMEQMNNYNLKMKQEVESLQVANLELQKMCELNSGSNNYSSDDSVMVEKNKQLKINHEMISVLRTENGKLENRIRNLEQELSTKQSAELVLKDQIKSLKLNLNGAKIENKNLEKELEKEKKLPSEVNIDPLLSKIRCLENTLETQQSMIQQLTEKSKVLEKENMSLSFQLNENKEEFERKVKEVENHNEVLINSNDQLKQKLLMTSKTIDDSPARRDLESKIHVLESKLTQAEQKYEDVQFYSEQLKQTSESLKYEIKDLNGKLVEERKAKHSTELEMIKIKESNSELSLLNSQIQEDLTNLRNQLNLSLKIQMECESALKNERRKAANIEREHEQLDYQHSSHVHETNEIIQGFKTQVTHLKSENKNLNKRLENILRNDQKKLEEERNSHMATKEKLRMIEEYGERMDIQNENLRKKVNFFKNQNLTKSQTFTTIRNPEDNTCRLIETSMVKEKLMEMSRQVINIKEAHRKEKERLIQEMGYFRNQVASLTEVLAIRIRVEAKKNKYYEKDISRLKKDVQYLVKINEEFTSTKGSKTQLRSHISNLSPVDTQSNFSSIQINDISHNTYMNDYKSPSNFGATGQKLSPINKINSYEPFENYKKEQTQVPKNSFIDKQKYHNLNLNDLRNPVKDFGFKQEKTMRRSRSRNLYSLNRKIHYQNMRMLEHVGETLLNKENMINGSNASESNLSLLRNDKCFKRKLSNDYLTFQSNEVLKNNVSFINHFHIDQKHRQRGYPIRQGINVIENKQCTQRSNIKNEFSNCNIGTDRTQIEENRESGLPKLDFE